MLWQNTVGEKNKHVEIITNKTYIAIYPTKIKM